MNYKTYRGLLNTDLIEGMSPSGSMELPAIFRTNARPDDLISFDKAITNHEYGQWVHFFIHDIQFQRIWRNPWRYLPILVRFKGVISPDFSIFWSYPRYKQLESVSHSREIGAWLQRNGVSVIPCVRWGKKNTFDFAFDGIEPGGTIAVGTVGVMREKEARKVFEEGFGPMLEAVTPKCIVVYGSRKSAVFADAEEHGIEIVQFDTNTAKAFS